jgi:hypothetical protein
VERQPVSSSNIASVGYDPNSETLEIEFIHTGIYQYYNVPQFQFDRMLEANSVGTFFNAEIKNSYPCSKM